MSEVGIANVWLCPQCGRFEFTKPEVDDEHEVNVTGGAKRFCFCTFPVAYPEMTLLADQAVISVRHVPGRT